MLRVRARDARPSWRRRPGHSSFPPSPPTYTALQASMLDWSFPCCPRIRSMLLASPLHLVRRLSEACADLPALLAATAEHGGIRGRAVMIIQPVWLTPKRYARLPSLGSRRGLSIAAAGGAALWPWVSEHVFPEGHHLVVDAVAFEPVLAEPTAKLLILGTVLALIGLVATAKTAGLRLLQWFGGIIRAGEIQPPPFGYHLRIVSGEFAWVALILMIGAGLVHQWRTPFLQTLSAIELWPSPAILPAVALAAAGMFLNGSTQRLRALEVYGDEQRARLYGRVSFVLLALCVLGVGAVSLAL